MNTIHAIHLDQWVEEGGAGVPEWISSTVKPRSDARDARSFFFFLARRKMRRFGARGGKREAQRLASTPVARLLSRGPGGQEPRKQPCLHKSAQFQPDINHTRKIDEEFFFNNRACLGKWPPDLCLISSPNADRDPYCQLSLAQLGLAAP